MLSRHENMGKPEAFRRMNDHCKIAVFANWNTHFSNVNNNPQYPVWWFYIPLKKVDEPGAQNTLHLICYDRRTYKLYHLAVPTSHFRENLRSEPKLLIIPDKQVISLELSIHNANLFQDRYRGCRFGEFKHCDLACEHA
jgi:hypothetical protein